MAFDLRYLIESEFDLFKDQHASKRGKRHLRDGAGLNLNRKHQGIIADVHKADPNQIGAVERLRKLERGRDFVTFQEGDKLRQKYGLKEEIGFLGTTGIKIIKNQKGYDLVKEATIVATDMDNRRFKVRNPDDIWGDLPGQHVTFCIKDGIVFYKIGVGDTHHALTNLIKNNAPGQSYQVYPRFTKAQGQKLRTELDTFIEKWKLTASEDDLIDWGVRDRNCVGNPRIFFEITGRLGYNYNVAAFWNTIAKVNEYAPLLKAFFHHINFTQDPTIVAIDNPDTRFGSTDITQKINSEIMRRQHVSPELKKVSGAHMGSHELSSAAQKAGFKSSAEYNQQKIVGDSVIYETPEAVLGMYNRADYANTEYLFLSNFESTGIVCGLVANFPSHSTLYRAVRQGQTENIIVIGDINKDSHFDFDRSGMVLPKQESVPSTYISCWDQKCKELKLFIDQLLKLINAQGPFYYEINNLHSTKSEPGKIEVYQ